jgi:transposase
MANSFRPWAPRQQFLLPPSPMEWLSDDHLVYFVLDVVEQLDLSKIERRYLEKDGRGTRPYDPTMMVALLVYGYCIGVASSRRLERATYEDVAFRVLSGGEHPDHTRISEFRRVNISELAELFVQVLRLCQEAGLVKLGHVSLDGTKVQANASKHKAMSYERMKENEKRLLAEVEELMQRAEAADGEEDAKFGKGRRGDELPEELARRETRLARIREAKKKLEAEAAAARAVELREQAERASRAVEEADDDERPRKEHRAQRVEERAKEASERAKKKAAEAEQDEPRLERKDEEGLPQHQVGSDKDGKPTPKAQRNFTDPDSRIMKKGSDYLQGYNAQTLVDEANQVIVAQALTNQAPDVEHLVPMLDRLEAACGARPKKLSADSGYWSEANARHCEQSGIDAYLAVDRDKHNRKTTPAHGRPPENLDARGRMKRKLATARGRAVYARRKAIVEPPFGQIKEARGFRRFLLRGKKKVRGEWALICATHNLLKLYGAAVA